MRHSKWISSYELNRWSDTDDAKQRLPEVIRRLIHATVEPTEIGHIDFHSAEESHRPGFDGLTSIKSGNAKVPAGITYWELSASTTSKKKLDSDYSNRVLNRGDGDFSATTYIAVTSRDYQNKSKWIEEKQNRHDWGEVRLYDSSDIEQWLETAPGVAVWLLSYLRRGAEGVVDLLTHWENIVASLKRPLPPESILRGRKLTEERFQAWSEGEPSTLQINGHSPQEVIDVFSAWACSLPEPMHSAIASRAVIVDQIGSWRALVESPQRLVLVVAERLEIGPDLIAEARRKGHHVLVPQTLLVGQRDVHRTEMLDRAGLQSDLEAAGVSEQDAHILAQQSAGSFTVLRRLFSSVPNSTRPKWGSADEADELAPLLLAGAWLDGHLGDQAIISRLAKCSYEESRKVINRWRSEPDAPVRWAGGIWEFLSPSDAWIFLSSSVVFYK